MRQRKVKHAKEERKLCWGVVSPGNLVV